MILAPLAGATLLVSVATGPLVEPKGAPAQLTLTQKTVALQPLMRSATDCIARTVAGDRRLGAAPSPDLSDLIVASMPSCVAPVRAMIEAYDRYFGEGTGESFFMGPYLDVLPNAVDKWIKNSTP